MAYRIRLSDLSDAKDMWSVGLTPIFSQQLRDQGRQTPDNKSYRVDVVIIEGRLRPKADIENYVKPVIDSLTYAQLLWTDDRQIDELHIKRSRDASKEKSEVILSIETCSPTEEAGA
jgi:Holliday junction resolvase RusA-like endonuclease